MGALDGRVDGCEIDQVRVNTPIPAPSMATVANAIAALARRSGVRSLDRPGNLARPLITVPSPATPVRTLDTWVTVLIMVLFEEGYPVRFIQPAAG
ncbi:MAG: hypothetical protein J2P19_25795, partial [Pseudonocardia sp.]|nr:hypothetical protein [Pseudonocardia sp.]